MDSVLKRSYGYVTIWPDGNSRKSSEKVLIGWNKPNTKKASLQKAMQEIEKAQIEVRKYAHVHKKLLDKAIIQNRPVGAKAHKKVIEAHADVADILNKAKAEKKPLPSNRIIQLLKQLERRRAVACGKDGTFPRAPIAKFYEHNGKKYLKAQFQDGWDRRPMCLALYGDFVRLLGPNGRAIKLGQNIRFTTHDKYLEARSWHKAGHWRQLRILRSKKVGTEITGPMMIKKGKEFLCRFDIPALDGSHSTNGHETIGERIRRFRKKKGITQKELGRLVGRSGSTISAYERFRRVPSTEFLKKILKALGGK